MWLGEDNRRTWFKELSWKDRLKANEYLKASESISNNIYQQITASRKFTELTGLEAEDVLYSFMEYGYCYGDQYIPACLERKQYEEICI